MNFYLFDENTSGPPRKVQISDATAIGTIEDCGPAARAFATISLATCQQTAELERVLADQTWLSYRPPEIPQDLAKDTIKASYGFFALGTNVGCARVVSSRDGRVRIWAPKFERLLDVDDENPESSAGDVIKRGVAIVQWLDSHGVVHVQDVTKNKPDLHLDTVVDSLERFIV